MQIILKENIENLGYKDDLVKVKNGYGRNYLIPQGKAILATTSAKRVLAENIKQRAFKEKKIIDDATALGEKIMALEVKIASKVGSGDKLFGSVSALDLVNSFEAKGLAPVISFLSTQTVLSDSVFTMVAPKFFNLSLTPFFMCPGK